MMPVPTALSFRRVLDTAIEDTLSPPSKDRTTDANTVSFPLPLTITIIGLVIGIAGFLYRIDTKVGVIETAMSYERQLGAERMQRQSERDTDYRNYINQRFETLEAKIESAGLRNFNATLAQELAKTKGK